MLEGLGTVSAHEDALALLGVGASLRADVERNTRLHAEPAAPAHQVYSGVLYDALDYNSLTPAQRKKADASVLVISALWGAIRFGDRVPAYRLSMATSLPDVGRLASWWHTDGDLGRNLEVVTDMSKSRLAGFTGYRRTEDSFIRLFDRLARLRLHALRQGGRSRAGLARACGRDHEHRRVDDGGGWLGLEC